MEAPQEIRETDHCAHSIGMTRGWQGACPQGGARMLKRVLQQRPALESPARGAYYLR
jgi:hypothetical protein